ncbi:methylaspartate mutase subunit E [Paludibacterium purpuratum]|uniref:Glutamate mutase epsilon subunit n=1 Tax=Paludibacterium purpuratum TaxID=1144873 RepID=A0A4R7BCJ0_9NEIS|nr:methylaspartate mutase subunit E [Paludibacterium purpuratum]TDR82754.1 glutamate mutase subunit E [Paludibacterium purpuratum]
MELTNKKIELPDFLAEREQVLTTWPTGKDVKFADGVKYQESLPEHKRFAAVLKKADAEGKTLSQPRAGVALVDEHIALLQGLQTACDLLPSTIDAYTRLNRYEESAKGIAKSREAGTSLLNGFPAVNHGLAECRRVVEAVDKPVQVRHGTPDARLLAEITLAGGFSAYEGGGISYNIPYAKKVSLEKSIRDWQYCDRLVGLYEEHGVRINREPFGPLSGTLVPPFISHSVAIIEGLLALEQGVRSITVGYGQVGNMVQDIAAIRALRELADEYFRAAGFDDFELTTVFHQWMGGFPENEAMAFSVISWGGAVAGLSGATKVIVKTPHEARGIPTMEANRAGLNATRQILNMVQDQVFPNSDALAFEVELIKREVRAVMSKVFELGNGDIAVGTVRAFEAGVIDVPFAPAACNAGKLLPVRDNHGAVRVFEAGQVPLPEDVLTLHRDLINERARAEGREPSFQMVVDDIYAISKSTLIGRPAK